LSFVNGDIVEHDGIPSVLTYLPHWRTEKPGKTYEEMVDGVKFSDGSDMIGNVHYVNDEGGLDYDHIPYKTLRYWHGEIRGRHRFIRHLSHFIKNRYGYDDIHEITTLIEAFCKYKAEADGKALERLLEYAEERLNSEQTT